MCAYSTWIAKGTINVKWYSVLVYKLHWCCQWVFNCCFNACHALKTKYFKVRINYKHKLKWILQPRFKKKINLFALILYHGFQGWNILLSVICPNYNLAQNKRTSCSKAFIVIFYFSCHCVLICCHLSYMYFPATNRQAAINKSFYIRFKKRNVTKFILFSICQSQTGLFPNVFIPIANKLPVLWAVLYLTLDSSKFNDITDLP